MLKTRYLPLLMLAATPLANTEPAVLSDGQMTIPEGAVISPEWKAYFTDITLTQDDAGRLVLTSATQNPLVTVESINVAVMESFPVQVSVAVSGYLSAPCVELLSPAVAYADNTFTVVLAASALEPGTSCIQVIQPFESSVPLDVEGLPAGTYSVDVNGITAKFILETDNSLP